ncbi:hypothetical protein WAX88_17915 [Photobacterium damselae subsp. damselae]|uniref:Uncharacterized protein n=1 Tax=Photobacterium damsela subsp. piscicida TaxID=38294 RepID=A0A1Q9GZE4_PHODP|nr:hypothetical protein [Photobacterium damselae]MBE8126633.1 hypothetical protein [Photobacterium damselae subsp. piscicida]OLQ80606.1 hypothetical protein BEI67_11330 [Photobacterium damselae subsp. piscicida]PSV73707.1 hypothetical protein CTT35_09465 [Photobacterium damselae]PSW77713.1 hypothetical protein CTT37_09925 [Photobacterium damselae]QOD54562.1 hypothetical protein IC628_15840 [Photobacterium damselae subsp. piscicida]
MTNYDLYLQTVDRLNDKLTDLFKFVYWQPTDNELAIDPLFVDEAGCPIQKLKVSVCRAQNIHMTSDFFKAYWLRGLARIAPLRQAVFNRHLYYWLTQSVQQFPFHLLSSSLLTNLSDDETYPFPSLIRRENSHLPCWVLARQNDEYLISIIESRTGQLYTASWVKDPDLIEDSKWFEAQVIDSVLDSSSKVEVIYQELIEEFKEQRLEDDVDLQDILHAPSLKKVSSLASVGLVFVIVIAFFIFFKYQLGF